MPIKRDSLMPHDVTAKRFREMRDAYANKQKLGKVTTDHFLRLLMNKWENPEYVSYDPTFAVEHINPVVKMEGNPRLQEGDIVAISGLDAAKPQSMRIKKINKKGDTRELYMEEPKL